jgi:type IV secretory pathway VirB4 component
MPQANPWGFYFELRYPKNNQFLGTLIVGAAGSGKSNEYKPSMENTFKLGAKCIVFDPS